MRLKLPKKFKLLLDENSSKYSSKSNELDSSYLLDYLIIKFPHKKNSIKNED